MNRLILMFVLLIGILLVGVYWIISDPEIIGPEDSIGQPVRFQLQWFDQAQFAGFYVAEKKGYYREEGLHVTVTPGGFATRPVEMLESGQADIALSTADQVAIQMAAGKNITALGVVFDRSMVCFMSRKTDLIKTPLDFRGKVIGVYSGFDTENILHTLLRKFGVKVEDVDIRSAGQLAAFENGDFDVWPSYRFNEPLQMRRAGIPVDCLYPEDFGVSYYSDAIIVSDKFLKEHRDAVVRFVRASARGWRDAVANPTEAIDLMFNMEPKLNLPDDPNTRQHQTEMIGNLLAYVDRPGDLPTFWMDPQRTQQMIKHLVETGKFGADRESVVMKKMDFHFAEEATQK